MVHAENLEYARGRKEWDMFELMVAEATGTGNITPPDLKGPVHKLFRREAWHCTNLQYTVLVPSMALATKLLEVGMPYISNFLPLCPLYEKPGGINVIPIKPLSSIFPPDIRAAKEQLDEIADDVTWQINYFMYGEPDYNGQKLGWVGITRSIPDSQPWYRTSAEEIERADQIAQEAGHTRRPLIVGLMGQYIQALQLSPINSEAYLRAVFMAAITMVHELGHVIYHKDFRCSHSEPHAGDDCAAELGFSFVSWLFSGFHPQFETAREGVVDFQHTLYWEPQYTMAGDIPLYKTLYSIPIAYIQEKLTQAFWDGFGSPSRHSFLAKARKALVPDLEPDQGIVATSRVPNFKWDDFLKLVVWKDKTWQKAGYRMGGDVLGLTTEEIELERVRDRQLSGHTNAWQPPSTEQEKRQIQNILNSRTGAFDEDDDLEVGFGEKDFDYRAMDETTNLVDLINIDDGVLEADVVPPLEPSDVPLTKIIVQYLAGETVSKKHPRAADDESGPQRKKLKMGHIQDCGDGGIPDYYDVETFLESICPDSLQNMSRLTAHKFCVSRKLHGYAKLQPTPFWQQSQLSLSDPGDIAVAGRIAEYLLQWGQESEKFKNDKHALLSIKEASLAGVSSWNEDDLTKFCQDHNINTQNTTVPLIRLVEHRKKADIAAFRAVAGRRHAYSNRNDQDEIDSQNLPVNMTEKALIEYCARHSLPDWGNRQTLIARVRRNQRADFEIINRGDTLIRAAQPERIDRNGFETYIFRSILGQSTVAALKNALYVEGNFDSEAMLKLFFYPNERDVLEDSRPLSHYADRDWGTLRLKTWSKWRFGPGSVSAKPIDLTVAGKPKLEWHGVKPRPKEATPGPDPVDVQAERERDIKTGKVEPTVAELLMSVSKRAALLGGIVRAGPGDAKAGIKPRVRRSGLEISDEVQDLEEAEEGFVLDDVNEPSPFWKIGNTPHVAGRGHGSELKKKTHMQAIFHKIRNPRDFVNSQPVNALNPIWQMIYGPGRSKDGNRD